MEIENFMPYEEFIKLKIPTNIAYKYRDWNNDYHKKILTENELFFSSFENLNDLFDGHIPFRFDVKGISKEEYKKVLKKDNKYEYQQLTKKDIDSMYRCFQSGQDWKDMLQSHRDFVNSIYGVMSLSISSTIAPMWAHYGGNHSGFAIGFNLLELCNIVEGTMDFVKYTIEPILMPFGNTEVYDYQELFFTKSPEWEYEQEIRLLKTFHSNKVVNLNRNCISEIVFGKRMNQKDKDEIINIVNQNFDNVSFYQIEENIEKLELKKIKL